MAREAGDRLAPARADLNDAVHASGPIRPARSRGACTPFPAARDSWSCSARAAWGRFTRLASGGSTGWSRSRSCPRRSPRIPAFAERFTREARALARLNHPHIVTLHDFGEAGGLYYFLMEFVDGVNLRQMIAGGKLEPREALAIVPQICEALQYAHDEGIVHRDIKPENHLARQKGPREDRRLRPGEADAARRHARGPGRRSR